MNMMIISYNDQLFHKSPLYTLNKVTNPQTEAVVCRRIHNFLCIQRRVNIDVVECCQQRQILWFLHVDIRTKINKRIN